MALCVIYLFIVSLLSLLIFLFHSRNNENVYVETRCGKGTNGTKFREGRGGANYGTDGNSSETLHRTRRAMDITAVLIELYDALGNRPTVILMRILSDLQTILQVAKGRHVLRLHILRVWLFELVTCVTGCKTIAYRNNAKVTYMVADPKLGFTVSWV